MEDEDTFHIFIQCPHAYALWQAMMEVWELPSRDKVQNTGNEWLLHLLNEIPEHQRANMLMLFWRIWHAPPIESSRRFLVSYLNSLLLIKQFPDADITKGKMVLEQASGFKKKQQVDVADQRKKPRWIAPAHGEAKLNTDGAYTQTQVGIGMILRDEHGDIIVVACRKLNHRLEATEAEMMAIEEGLQVAMQWFPGKISMETDCAEAVDLIKDTTPNTLAYAFRINVIRELLRKRGCKLNRISREANSASHELARLGRVQGRTKMWLCHCLRN
jgi:ribonuclease HI